MCVCVVGQARYYKTRSLEKLHGVSWSFLVQCPNSKKEFVSQSLGPEDAEAVLERGRQQKDGKA